LKEKLTTVSKLLLIFALNYIMSYYIKLRYIILCHIILSYYITLLLLLSLHDNMRAWIYAVQRMTLSRSTLPLFTNARATRHL